MRRSLGFTVLVLGCVLGTLGALPEPNAITFNAGQANSAAGSMPAFPGAEGFGARATGGRGGRVLYVTTLASDPNGEITGSLNWALGQEGPRYILFKVSGVIQGAAQFRSSDATLAGQTSPGGIIVRGLWCDGGHYVAHTRCDNLIVRHIRSRPASHLDNGANTDVLDDALRLDGIERFIIDHSSFANASDEVIQISWAKEGTLQNVILAETPGEHYEYGGMLLNYSHSKHPQDNLSIHHNLWYRIGGRLPEITCATSSELDGVPEYADCLSHSLHLELSSNLLWDPGFLVWYNRFVNLDEAFGLYQLTMNMVDNYMVARPQYPYALMVHDVLDVAENSLYVSGNRLSLYPDFADYQLAYCCNDFAQNGPNTDLGVAERLPARHDFPAISYTRAEELASYMIANAGAFPRDPMDRRFLKALATGEIDLTPLDQPGALDALQLDFDANNPPLPPQDSDDDGMPDDFELRYGLNLRAQDHNGTQLSLQFSGIEGYTNLECYLNWLSDNLVYGRPLP